MIISASLIVPFRIVTLYRGRPWGRQDRRGTERTHAGEDEGAAHHEEGLQRVGVHDGGEAPGDGENGGHGQQHRHTHVQRALGRLVHGLLDEERPGVQVGLRQGRASEFLLLFI